VSDPQLEDVVTDIFANDMSSVFILTLAVIGITGEWRHRTITGALLAAPDRLRFLAAKAVAFAGAGLVISLLISAAVTVVGLVFVGVRDLPGPAAGELGEYVMRSAGLAALGGAFGVALGALVRNQVGAIVGVLVATFILEPVELVEVVHDLFLARTRWRRGLSAGRSGPERRGEYGSDGQCRPAAGHPQCAPIPHQVSPASEDGKT
jgi:hypothetical protein